ncbi:M20/M25/M40 family metallo-hydrolase [Conexibacter sp. JD483]|uniref:M20/M25/M40 family metallo-hydrolase n=1 Tax=unclassified Conexibacter TaxID=2627773 RepID=UPI00271B9B78|nr:MULTISPECIES: M20/M25/M40 family metallo-hydrolase [unclassified Conexibacter]MDO8187561.1 M20/M25/M40 family metallo-hydrolase [Conexibacter sp. CPCC 205706]MDO8198927.1 M20/M25/M40 family metallo-hydrolase [Conexibacter sp. CPCC 205762]MDR9370366.1 M20/M25/M40 family metallo-hydrolase [Conexibacter sp. JD483]
MSDLGETHGTQPAARAADSTRRQDAARAAAATRRQPAAGDAAATRALTADRLRALVEHETPTGDRARIAAAFQTLREWVEPALGRPGELVTVDGVDHLLFAPAAEPYVLLLGHVDTVWPLGTLADWPFTLDADGIARGPGIFDMKAGLVAAAGALATASDPSRVALLVSGDEEIGSLTSRALIEQLAARAEAVLVLEPSERGALKLARCGASIYRVRFEGRAAHAGLEPERGANALTELSRQVLASGEIADAAAGTTVTPTVASAGTVTNTVPAQAELMVDVRARTLAELERVDRWFAALAATDPQVTIAVEGGINRPPLEQESSRELFALAQEAARDAGLAALDGVAVGGASDGNFTAALGVPTLDGLGPLGGGAHARSEWVSLDAVVERSRLIAGIIDAIAARRRGEER